MNRNDLRRALPGAMLLAALGLVACDGGGDAQGMGGVEEEGTGTGTGTYLQEDTREQELPATGQPPAEQAPGQTPAGQGSVDDQEMMGTGGGDAWGQDESTGAPETQRSMPGQEQPRDATQPQGSQTPVR